MKDKLEFLKKCVLDFVKTKKLYSIIGAIVLSIVIFIVLLIVCKNTDNYFGNLVNNGFTAKAGKWTYYLKLDENEIDGIYKVNASGSKTQKVSSDYGLYLNVSR